MGIGVAGGENRAVEAARAAISSPLLEASVEGAHGILLNITGGADLGLFEINEAAEIINSAAEADCNIIFGAVIDPSLGDEVRVTVIATGFDRDDARAPEVAVATEAPAQRSPLFANADKPKFDVDDDVLDIPSFLKDR
jgi:cell division protein FtsZ